MNKNIWTVLGLIGLLLIAYIMFSRQQVTAPETLESEPMDITSEELDIRDEFVFVISEQNDSGESGTATISEQNGELLVTLSMTGYPEDTPQPTHIHTGSCPDVGGVVYPLENVVNGESVTSIEVGIDDLREQLPLAINVHQSVPEASVYTACGDLDF
jgi:hypothetical protein